MFFLRRRKRERERENQGNSAKKSFPGKEVPLHYSNVPQSASFDLFRIESRGPKVRWNSCTFKAHPPLLLPPPLLHLLWAGFHGGCLRRQPIWIVQSPRPIFSGGSFFRCLSSVTPIAKHASCVSKTRFKNEMIFLPKFVQILIIFRIFQQRSQEY